MELERQHCPSQEPRLNLSAAEQPIWEKVADIKNTLLEAKSAGTNLNEAMTEFIIIDPLLHALGYQPWEIHKRGHDAVAGTFPDYTLLPGSPHKWFLEVKRLDLALKDGEAAQAVSYAYNQGAQWAVLTNGRTWYIYNAHLPVPLAEKRVFQIDNLLDNPESLHLFLLMSRQSMSGDGLTQAWQADRLTAFLRRALSAPGSAARKYLRKIAGGEMGASISEALLSQALTAVFALPPTAEQTPAPPPTSAPDTEPGTEQDALDEFGPWYTLEQLAQNAALILGRKPARASFAGKKAVALKSWTQAAQETVLFVGASYGLPALPYVGTEHGKKYFLNTEPLRPDGKPMITSVGIEMSGKPIYLDTNRSAQDIARVLSALLKAVGAPTDAVKIALAEAAQTENK